MLGGAALSAPILRITRIQFGAGFLGRGLVPSKLGCGSATVCAGGGVVGGLRRKDFANTHTNKQNGNLTNNTNRLDGLYYLCFLFLILYVYAFSGLNNKQYIGE